MLIFRGIPLTGLLSVLCAIVSGVPWSPISYPNPVVEAKACHRMHTQGTSYVCDPDDILSVEAADKIEAIFNAIVKDTTSPCQLPKKEGGYQVALALMNSFETDATVPMETNAGRMARGLHDKWGVGHHNCHDGVLVMVSVSQRQVYISTGEAAGAILSSDRISWVTERMKGHMRAHEYDEALIRVASDIYHILTNDDIIHGAYDSLVTHLLYLFFVGFFLKIVHSIYMKRRGTARFAECKAKLIKIDRLKQKASQKGSTDGITTPSICPICLEDLNSSQDDSTDEAEDISKNNVSSDGSDRSDSVRLLSRNNGAAHSKQHSGDFKGSGRPSAALPNCNHEFCVDCIERWLQEQSSQGKEMTCPLCRSSIDHDNRSGSSAAATNNYNHSNNNYETYTRTDYAGTYVPDEGTTGSSGARVALASMSLMFMLGSLQSQYPEFVDDEMRSEWEREPLSHRSYHDRLEARNPARAQDAVRTDFGSASGSVHTSFGGGSSSGGGGNSW
ncbi:hypothetical protein SARC_02833 [Sphaeroforma arctica JP610]|uniref:RING-type domain-containing protein n=1 Tax=Sphaeroforma arctica JP610 TaxID=667725 RepID=A0A0L0G9N7_9EUKA|nr:hypothetical protein SARC_02833 [Sphaeroforma arctica JP610]KNC84978.1 hypothetical protein SARC_02833 [Sphaeroforma arctica JP610]|eukprot:XP_014158880.1 hypothetical protein SARC_02833 [Sphaeroforma arctica JP610]